MAERLYLEGYITYPRTESTSYPDKFNFKGVVTALSTIPIFSDYSNGLLKVTFIFDKS